MNYLACLKRRGFSHIRMMVMGFFFSCFVFFFNLQQRNFSRPDCSHQVKLWTWLTVSLTGLPISYPR